MSIISITKLYDLLTAKVGRKLPKILLPLLKKKLR
jgi:hypothetical protein